MANIVVLFEVKPTKAGMKKYLDLAAMLKPLLAGFEGFIRAERFSSLNEDGKLLSMNIWTDEAAVERWRNAMQHRMSQKEGREKLFESYKITVCSEIRSYTNTERTQAPQDSNQYFELKGLIMQYTSHYCSPIGDILLAADDIGLREADRNCSPDAKAGFDVYISADHGNTPCVGMGKLMKSGVETETKSHRMVVLKDLQTRMLS